MSIAWDHRQIRSALLGFVESPSFKRVIVALIVINAVLLGAETFRGLPADLLGWLFLVNRVILWIFVAELSLRIAAHGRSFFRDPWSLFDLVIVAAAVIPPPGPLQVLRALRILRALRLVARVSSLRLVVDGLLRAIPGLASIVVLLLLLLYISAVMATHFFRDAAPEYFGHLGASLLTLFQVMTLENWPDVAAEVRASLPWAWVFFVGYILVATFMVLNLFIGVVVSAIQSRIDRERTDVAASDGDLRSELAALQTEIAGLRADLASLADTRRRE